MHPRGMPEKEVARHHGVLNSVSSAAQRPGSAAHQPQAYLIGVMTWSVRRLCCRHPVHAGDRHVAHLGGTEAQPEVGRCRRAEPGEGEPVSNMGTPAPLEVVPTGRGRTA